MEIKTILLREGHTLRPRAFGFAVSDTISLSALLRPSFHNLVSSLALNNSVSSFKCSTTADSIELQSES